MTILAERRNSALPVPPNEREDGTIGRHVLQGFAVWRFAARMVLLLAVVREITNSHKLQNMPPVRSVAVLVGSLRKDSFTRKVANVLIQLAPPSLSLEIVEIGQVAFYNQDLEVKPPAHSV